METETILSLCLMPLVTGLTILAVEYGIMIPYLNRKPKTPPNLPGMPLRPIREKDIQQGDHKRTYVNSRNTYNRNGTVLKMYHRIMAVILGVVSSVAAVFIVREVALASYNPNDYSLFNTFILDILGNSEFVLLVNSVIALIAGGVVGYIIYDYLESNDVHVFHRYSLVLIICFFIGLVSLLLIPVAFVGLMIYALITEETKPK